MSIRTSLPAALFLVVITVAACTGGGGAASPVPATDGSTNPSAAPSVAPGAISHPTGADDIILRFDESGGMMIPEWFAAHAPTFTLYGDGTVVFASAAGVPGPGAGGVAVNAPLRIAKLSEEQVQAFLEYALADGGLAAARSEYQNPLVADASTATFEINADGIEKTVSVVALGLDDMEPNADTAIKKAMAELGTRLRDFDAGGSLQSAPYEPAAYRGVLTPAEGLQGVTFTEWPWTDLAASDFVAPADAMALPQARHTLTPAQAAALGVEGYQGGIGGGIYLRDDAGKTYTFALRPLLPDEAE